MKTSKTTNEHCELMKLAVLASLTMVCVPAWAGSAGEVITITGQATAASQQGDIRPLNQGAALNSGDTVVTNPNSWLRMKFSDGGFVILRPNTRFVIEDFKDTNDPGEDRSIFNLVKGGFRAITGLVGKRNPKNYQVRTAIATIGIRGTDHQGRLCQDDCLDVDPPPANGLYTGTDQGETDVGGEIVDAGEYSFTDNNGNTQKITRGQATPLTTEPAPPPNPADCHQ